MLKSSKILEIQILNIYINEPYHLLVKYTKKGGKGK
jgi:hypothetical protein